jgi:hypothetical protein
VVAIDPGHGGLPDAANPGQPFDPGAISAAGLMEKDVTLDVARRLAVLLRADLVDPVLTRGDDRWVDIPTREREAAGARAALFVSIHCNSFADASVGGSLVLYPAASSQAFAQTISDLLGHGLAPAGVGDDGIQLRDNWWIHNPMPTATAEVAYLSNPHDAALLATGQFHELVAAALRDGIERYDPEIVVRRAQLLAWRQANHGMALPAPGAAPVAAAAPASTAGSALGAVLAWLVGIAVAVALLRWREPVTRVAIIAATVVVRLLRGTVLRRVVARRRRRRLRARVLLRDQQQWTRTHSVYDELSL